VIKFNIPNKLMPKKWQPKKVKILAKGNRVSKFFGEDQISTRQVEVSLKLFDCGHFYMKQTLPGSGASPYWVIFEGRWSETDRGLRLEYLLRYSWQASRKPEMEFAIEAVPSDNESTLAFSGETENQLNGLVPAIVGEDQLCRIEIYREPDVVEKGPARFNEECPDPPSWKDPTPTRDPVYAKEPPSKQTEEKREEERHTPPKDETLLKESQPVERSRREQPAVQHRMPAQSVERQKPVPPRRAECQTPSCEDDEPMWPTYLGLAIFVFLFAFFGWLWWDEKRAAWGKDELYEEY